MPKIKFGLKNVHYAVATIAADGTATYGTPVAVPGAVSLSMEPQGDSSPFYADNIVYFTSISNTGYEGDLEMALFPDQFKKDILGYLEDSKHNLLEDVNAPAVHFALLFQIENDVNATRVCLFNCTAQRPSVGGSTKEDTIDPQTESATITATSIHVAAIDKDIAKATTTESTSSTDYTGFFTAVPVPTALATAATVVTT